HRPAQPAQPPPGRERARLLRARPQAAQGRAVRPLLERSRPLRQDHPPPRAARRAEAPAREDELAAYSALVEGDASLAMQRYLTERLTPREQADAALAAASDRTPRRDAAPAVIRESMLFPYQE